ncbi:MAG TPA: hypothetical protein VGO47_00260 [Chlamydiales bacterium]|jgi:hypothetical protein|nr:hypothetical protein [Chlamydiales bacterium]
MYKVLFTLFVGFVCFGYAGTREIPESVRKVYAEKFHNAFVLQCNGLSTKAFFMCDEASKMAIQAGEDAQKINALWDLFRWYRTYGSAMALFAVEPTGNNIIYPDGTRPSVKSLRSFNYYSEYGRTPEQAAQVREFMFGVANTISGIFCIVVGGGIVTPVGAVGLTLAASGFYMMFNSLNNCYADYERAKLDLQAFETKMKNACEKDK